jgi:cytochrome c-type biogenesis protein CcmH
MARRWLPWIVLAVVVVGAVTWAAWPGGSPTLNERAHDLATELKCPDCEGLSVADSNTSTAGAIRADIKQRLARGQSDSEIKQHFVDLYGESILLSPSGSGLGFLVWGLPVVALLIGAGGLVIALRRWQRQPRMHATDADVALVEQARDRAS